MKKERMDSIFKIRPADLLFTAATLLIAVLLPQCSLASDWEVKTETGFGINNRFAYAMTWLEDEVYLGLRCSPDSSRLRISILTDKHRIDSSGKTLYTAAFTGADGAEHLFLALPALKGDVASLDLYTVVADDNSRHLADAQANWLFERLLSAGRPVELRIKAATNEKEVMYPYEISHRGSTKAMEKLAAVCGRRHFKGASIAKLIPSEGT